MKKRTVCGLIVALSVIFGVVSFANPVLAESTLDKIEKSGKIKVGFREGSIPFAFIDP